MFVTNSFFASQWTLLPRLIHKWFCFDLSFPTFLNQFQGVLEHLFSRCWIIIDDVVDLSAIITLESPASKEMVIISDLTNWTWSRIYTLMMGFQWKLEELGIYLEHGLWRWIYGTLFSVEFQTNAPALTKYQSHCSKKTFPFESQSLKVIRVRSRRCVRDNLRPGP